MFLALLYVVPGAFLVVKLPMLSSFLPDRDKTAGLQIPESDFDFITVCDERFHL